MGNLSNKLLTTIGIGVGLLTGGAAFAVWGSVAGAFAGGVAAGAVAAKGAEHVLSKQRERRLREGRELRRKIERGRDALARMRARIQDEMAAVTRKAKAAERKLGEVCDPSEGLNRDLAALVELKDSIESLKAIAVQEISEVLARTDLSGEDALVALRATYANISRIKAEIKAGCMRDFDVGVRKFNERHSGLTAATEGEAFLGITACKLEIDSLADDLPALRASSRRDRINALIAQIDGINGGLLKAGKAVEIFEDDEFGKYKILEDEVLDACGYADSAELPTLYDFVEKVRRRPSAQLYAG